MTITESAIAVKRARILLVEDDEDDYILTRGYLDELSAFDGQLTWVKNPFDGLKALLDGQYDVCLLDYQLGAETGLSLLKRAIDAGVSTPIIMLTGQPDKQLDLLALEYGAADFLVKSELSEARFARAIRYAMSRREFELERINRLRLEADNRSKDRFLAHLSHELRTPLSSILGYTELLLETDVAKAAWSELNIILNNGKHLLSLLNDVLDLSKITANKLELRPEPTNLRNIIVDIYTLLNVSAVDNGLTLSVNALTPLPETIMVDSTRLRQILINLVYNAIKFTNEGSITLDVWIQQINHSEQLFFRVSDTGIGIAADKLNDIFTPFMQIEDLITRKAGGAGLGLTISAELIQRMDGTLDVSSVEGQGSVFTFSIDPGNIEGVPKVDVDFDAEGSVNHQSDDKTLLAGSVLIVDDLVDLRKLAAHWVQATGAEVDVAANGAEAITMVARKQQQNAHYDLILMDLHMPLVDGRLAVIEIRKTGYQHPIVALTAATAKGIRQQLAAIGFTDVLSKPVNKSKLYRMLSAHLTAVPDSADATNGLVAIETTGTDQSTHAQPKHFLVVEDDVDAANLMQVLLDSLHVQATLAHSAASCLQTLQQYSDFDCILLDMGLPDSTGLELAQQVMQHYPNSHVVIVSGAEPDKALLNALGIQQVLLKPISRQSLADVVAQYQ